MDEQDQQALTGGVIQTHDLNLAQLWLEYIALGGNATEDEIRDYSSGAVGLPLRERDVLSQAVNEHPRPPGEVDARLAMAPYSDSPPYRFPEGFSRPLLAEVGACPASWATPIVKHTFPPSFWGRIHTSAADEPRGAP